MEFLLNVEGCAACFLSKTLGFLICPLAAECNDQGQFPETLRNAEQWAAARRGAQGSFKEKPDGFMTIAP
jgi:hypothetical protein